MHQVNIDTELCLGRKDCIHVCEPHVFGWHKPKGLGFLAAERLQIESRGYQAFVQHPEVCTACMACVTACPEGAIEVLADPNL